MSERPLYNSRITNAYVKLVERRYPGVDLKRLFRDAGIQPYEVSDVGHWFTQSQVNRFVSGLMHATGNQRIAREAGQFAASVQGLGVFKKYLLGLIGPGNAFSALEKACANLTRSASYESRRLSSNRIEIIVTPAPGVSESPFQCDNRLGFFEAILGTFDCNHAEIEHPECLFDGGTSCRYLVSWKEPLYLRVRRLRNYLVPGLSAAALALGPFYPSISLALIPTALFAFMTCSCIGNRLEKDTLVSALASLKESTDELLDQTGTNYKNAVMVNEVGQAISHQAGIDQVLENVVRALENRLSYDRALILLADPDSKRLSFRIGFGYSEEELAVLRKASFNLGNPESRGVFVTCFRERKPVLINDFSEVAEVHSSRSKSFADDIGAQSFLCCPIVCEGESLGVLAVDNIRTKKALVQSDLSLMMGIAPVIGMSIRNARYIDLEKQRSEQMRQSQKMEAVGQLAGGVAHDFNNLLTAIIGFATLARMHLETGNPAIKFLDEVLLASDRATHLTKGLLSFSRKQPIHLQPMELNSIVERMEKLLRRLISEEIELVLSYSDQPLPIVADAGQIDQILMNLATNARDAMEHCGVLTIKTGLTELGPNPGPGFGGAPEGSYATLTISDTGKGMDATTTARIFEPFYTTKEVGKGTGLGLAIVYGIVQQHSGFIDIASAPGQGTSFSIYLPIPAERPEAAHPLSTQPLPLRGSGTVLVVEDAPEVRLLTCQVLEGQGYQVIEAVDGEDALEKFRAHRDTIQLVIMDVVMPKLNGKEAYTEISQLKPGIKVLFTSGYTPDDVNRKGVRFDHDNFIAKPCSPEALLRMVADLMKPADLEAVEPGAPGDSAAAPGEEPSAGGATEPPPPEGGSEPAPGPVRRAGNGY
ncbi:histidine kinase [Geomonas silvestris]|uniref:histidine kinase n=1 Tax=Geomonas silvestris TaxID=2740184 RepID=A0A6V8MIC1_9BACT|nr:ATP-binding protein [Geomonas silvestris]GFO59722.1 histidine kinase [Geomonas silvestris]